MSFVTQLRNAPFATYSIVHYNKQYAATERLPIYPRYIPIDDVVRCNGGFFRDLTLGVKLFYCIMRQRLFLSLS